MRTRTLEEEAANARDERDWHLSQARHGDREYRLQAAARAERLANALMRRLMSDNDVLEK